MSAPLTPTRPSALSQQPNTTIPKVLGVLNIIFGMMLILWGLYSAAQYVLFPVIFRASAAQQQTLEAAMKAKRDEKIERLTEEIDDADTEEEKEQIRDELAEVESAPTPATPDLTSMFGMGDPHVVAWGLVDAATGVLLNTAMIVSGIGLLMLQGWGRRLALWVAGLKILRLIVSQSYYALVCVPIMARGVQDVMDEFGAQGPPGAGPSAGMSVGVAMSVMYTAWAVFLVVAGSVYPIICLWLLNRRRVKAAFGLLPPDESQA